MHSGRVLIEKVLVGIHEVEVTIAGAQLLPTASGGACCSSSSSCCCKIKL
jgi:hypothetical protein